MENKWDIGDFRPPKMLLHVCPVCSELVRECDKCGGTADDCISFSCGESQGRGHICYTFWDELHIDHIERDVYV